MTTVEKLVLFFICFITCLSSLFLIDTLDGENITEVFHRTLICFTFSIFSGLLFLLRTIGVLLENKTINLFSIDFRIISAIQIGLFAYGILNYVFYLKW